MSKGYDYTAKDFERYHNGGMTAAEMHQLEKAALNDPMLADALEGYRFSKTPAAEMASLQSRLQQRIDSDKKKNRVVWMQPWLRMAALAVVIAGAGWLVVNTFSTNENNLATSTPSLNSEERAASMADSTVTVLQQPPAAFPIDSNGQDVALQKPEVQKRTAQPPQAVSSSPVTVMRDTDAENNFSQNSANETAQALTLRQNELAAMKTEAPPAALQQQMDSAASRDVARRSETSMKEVVVVRGYGTTKARARMGTDSLGQPQIGWPAFEEYIAKNRKPFLPLAKTGASERSVELSFTIDPEGNPVNIEVVQSVNKEMDEEAIRLLKEGPRWKGRDGKVKILFPN